MLAPKRASGPITNIAATAPVARGLPIFTIGMLIAVVAIHFYLSKTDATSREIVVMDYGLVPGWITSAGDYSLGRLATFVTHAFLHANWGHVLANCYALFLFGLLAERFLGTVRVAVVYFASAIGGGLLFFAFNSQSFIPLVGASGAISGLFGAAIAAAPASARRALVGNAAVWLAVNVAMPAMAPQQGSRVAWEAHLGGFLVGLAIGWMLGASLPRAVVVLQPTGTTPTPADKPPPFNPVQRR